MQSIFTNLIKNKLYQNIEPIKKAYLNSATSSISTKYFVVDNLLPVEYANEIYNAFPRPNDMRLQSSFREKKYTYKQLNNTPKILHDITFALQHPSIIDIVSTITGIYNQIPDPSLYAGGLSLMEKDHFLNPHIDNSHDEKRKFYRTLNLLYYITPDWEENYGGNLELWNNNVTQAISISSLFNRLVVMETNQTSWHSVSPVSVAKTRCCVSNYYFATESPAATNYFHVTSFSARPNQKFRRLWSSVDNNLRMGLRKLKKSGFSKRDINTNDD